MLLIPRLCFPAKAATITRSDQTSMPANHTDLEKRLWEAADELRANSKLKSSEYSIPVLGLIFPLRRSRDRPNSDDCSIEQKFPRTFQGDARAVVLRQSN
jgi:hypothetical protein